MYVHVCVCICIGALPFFPSHGHILDTNRYIHLQVHTHMHLIHAHYIHIQTNTYIARISTRTLAAHRRGISFHRWHVTLNASPLDRQSVSLSVHQMIGSGPASGAGDREPGAVGPRLPVRQRDRTSDLNLKWSLRASQPVSQPHQSIR
jgi:hypothetical protein